MTGFELWAAEQRTAFYERVFARYWERLTSALRSGVKTSPDGKGLVRVDDYLPAGSVPSPSDADLVEVVAALMAADTLLHMTEAGRAV